MKRVAGAARSSNRGGSATRGLVQSVYPLDWHPDCSSPLAPTSRAPFPVRRSPDESCPDWVLVHVLEFLFQLGRGLDLEDDLPPVLHPAIVAKRPAGCNPWGEIREA